MTVPVTMRLMDELGIHEDDVIEAGMRAVTMNGLWLTAVEFDDLRKFLEAQVISELRNRSSIIAEKADDYCIDIMSIERQGRDGYLFKMEISLGTFAEERRLEHEEQMRNKGK